MKGDDWSNGAAGKNPRTPGARLIAITGGSGAGKSWLADQLQEIFGAGAARLSLDSFYRDRSHLPLARRERINYDHPRAIDWALLESVLHDCRAGRSTRLPRYNFATHSRLPAQERWTPKRLLLVDGLWLLHRASVRRCFDLSIFIECPARLRLSRRMERDLAERGRTRASVRRQFKDTVAPMHDRFVAPQRQWADLVLEPPLGRAEVLKVAEQIRKFLPAVAAGANKEEYLARSDRRASALWL